MVKYQNAKKQQYTAGLAKESIAIYQSIVHSCLVDRGSFLVSLKICRLSTINRSSFDSIFWINLPLRRSLLPDGIIKSRYGSRPSYEHLKYCLHLCLSNYEPSLSKLLQDMQCHASTSQ
jgi:hypothetical protein